MKQTNFFKKYEVRTDLAIDTIPAQSDYLKVIKQDGIIVTVARIDETNGHKIGKKPGYYTTIEFSDIADYENRKKIESIVTKELVKILEEKQISNDAHGLIIGLGNEKSTPDSLGPLTIEHILVTNHLAEFGAMEEGFRPISAFAPGVMGETGIETSELIKSTIHAIKPDFVIVIDALASSSIDRLNKTIQMSDAGIHPGSGVGNNRKEISSEKLGIPVIAIGIPTVVDAVTLVSDTLVYMEKHFTFHRHFSKKPMSKLVASSTIDFRKESFEPNEEDNFQLLGLVGSLNEEEKKELLFEVLNPIGYNFIVTPKEIDFLMEQLSQLLGNAINRSLHPNC